MNLAFSAWVLLEPMEWMKSWLELLPPPDLQWRLQILGVAAAQAVLALLLEHGLVEALVKERLVPRLRHLQSTRPPHERVTAQLVAEGATWPPLTEQQLTEQQLTTDNQLSARELLRRQTTERAASKP